MFSAAISELQAGLIAWSQRVEAVQKREAASADAGEATRSAAERWQPRPELLVDMRSLVTDGHQLAGRLRELRKPADVIAAGTTTLVQQATQSITQLRPWQRVVERLRSAARRTSYEAGGVQDHTVHLETVVDQQAEDDVARSRELLGLRSAYLAIERDSELSSNLAATVNGDADASDELIAGLRQSAATVADHSEAIGARVTTAAAAIDHMAGLAATLVRMQHTAADQIASTNREAERLGTPQLTTSARHRLDEISTLDLGTRRAKTAIDLTREQVSTWAAAVLLQFDAAIARASADVAEVSS